MSKERQQPCPTCRATLAISPGQESVTCGSCGATFRLKRAVFREAPDPPPPEPPPIIVTTTAPPAPHGVAPTPQQPPRRFPPLTPPTGPVPDPRRTMPVTIDEPVVNGVWLCIGFLLAPLIIAGIVAGIVLTVAVIGGAFVGAIDIIRGQ